MAVIVDTSFLIDLERHDSGAEALLATLHADSEDLIVPAVVAAEYLVGARDIERRLERLEGSTRILDFTRDDAVHSARLGQMLFADGSFPGWNDLLIAGMAERLGDLPIVTRNRRNFPASEILDY